jgi:hypothetical protein
MKRTFDNIFETEVVFEKESSKRSYPRGQIEICIREEDLLREEGNILLPLKLNIKPIHSDKN